MNPEQPDQPEPSPPPVVVPTAEWDVNADPSTGPAADFDGAQRAPVPVPVLALTALTSDRPGILMVVGILSLIFAAGSGLFALTTGLHALGLYVMSHMQNAMATYSATPMPASSPAVTATVPAVNTEGGLAASDSAVALSTLKAMQPLTAQQRAELRNFLIRSGQRLFPTGGKPLTAAVVKAGVSASSTDDAEGKVEFVTGWGTLDVFNDKAVFSPADHSSDIETSTHPRPVSSAPLATGMTLAPLTSQQAQNVIDAVKSQTQNKLNPAQISALRTALQSPTQNLVRQTNASSLNANARVTPDGSAIIQFSSGMFLTISPQGQTTQSLFPGAMSSISGATCAMVIGHSALSIMLAVVLFIAGILTLTGARSSRRLHRSYALLKIPLSILGAVAVVSMYAAAGNAFTPIPRAATVAWMVGLAVLGCIYPVALLIVMRMRSVRDYYARLV